jgi:O-antigen ligase
VIDRDLAPVQLDRLVAWSVGLAPVLLFALTWSDEFTSLHMMTRAFALPVVAIELVIVAVSFREGLRLGRPDPLLLTLLAALGLVVWGTAVTAPYPASALIRTGIWTIHLFFALAIVNLWHHRVLDLDEHIRALLTGFLVFFALLVAFVATTQQADTERVFGLPAFGHVRWFGYYAAGVIGLCAAGFLRGTGFAVLAATVAFAMVFWTGSRGAVVAALVGFLACPILLQQFRSLRAWLLFALSIVAGFAVSFVLDALVPIGAFGPDSMARYTSSGRIELWKDTLESIRMRPWLGWGDGQFSWSGGTGQTVAQPHNVALQVLYAWGLIGGLLCAALAALVAPRLVKARTVEAAPFQCAALTLGAYSFFDGTLYYVQSTSLFALCCAAAIAAGLPESARRPSSLPAD